mmetsp:Transcript_83854/g.237832  ORF Transcript_83854/g.237832 Transcript_83854/m.237832 type:complete len:232 (-) Transcript_83854:586-1281(-)
MWSPREARFVATSTALSAPRAAVLARKPSSVSSRSRWPFPEWRACAQAPPSLARSPFTSQSHLFFVLQNTRQLPPGARSLPSTSTSRPSFALWVSRTSTRWATALLALGWPAERWATLTSTAVLAVRARAASCTARGQVAVKKRVCLRLLLARPSFLGHMATMLSISGKKPASSMRSASSRTRQVTCLAQSGVPKSLSSRRKSRQRPGVAITRSAPFPRSAFACSPFGTPP